MFDLAVFRICVNGTLSEGWSDYFGAESMVVQVDGEGCSSTTLVTKPVDQSTLIGDIVHLNALGLPLVSVECLVESGPDGPTQSHPMEETQ
jgi:hypothetical protein